MVTQKHPNALIAMVRGALCRLRKWLRHASTIKTRGQLGIAILIIFELVVVALERLRGLGRSSTSLAPLKADQL